ncbi:MAG: type 2 isopentenyl-diphosphate Delta-isomerase [Candidatus Bilamarchaeaceae archaeon]
MTTKGRKRDHVEIVLNKGVQYRESAGFEKVQFVHNSLPEVDFAKIDISATFLLKKLKAPLMFVAMTGGYPDAKHINRKLAECAEMHGLAFGLGSQRAMIEQPSLKETYYVRDVAPNIPIVANIGAAQLKKYPFEKIESIVSAVEADALAVHLNPLQELVQPEGDREYSGVLSAIRKTADKLDVPVIAKETGAGISKDVALKLKSAGVSYIDLAGKGGTSWSKVENFRKPFVSGFDEWGISTLDSLLLCQGVLPLIASGGVRSGIDASKSLALGATVAGAAYPFLLALRKGRLDAAVEEWTKQVKGCCFLTGSKNLAELRRAKLFMYK